MSSLIDRLENAREGSPELSGLFAVASGIAEAVNPKNPAFVRLVGDDIYTRVAPYSESIDAALTALPEGWEWTLHSDGSGEIYRDVPPGMLPGAPGSTVIGFEAETPALGLCIAILKSPLTTEKEG